MRTATKLEIVQDGLAPDMFDIGGSRVSGTVRAFVSISENRNTYRPPGSNEPDDIVTVGIDLRGLTINGIAIRGGHYTQVNHPTGKLASYWPNSHVHREDDKPVTDAARDVVYEIAQEVARRYGTAENIKAARILRAEEALSSAEAEVKEAQAKADAAAKALAKIRGAK